ncbi:MAG: tyrosine--tRNA ligase, partial [Spirochaetia bacterium]|nr:tyrosine--tRNA ligase [Spirochaetia bacterium]
FIDFGEGKAVMVDNADWLLGLNYIDFLRDIGRFFSVNRMLAAECFKNRLESGLSFLEFNYMLMQAYDFLELYRRFNCKMQLGGNDQWSNIIAGVDLVRKADSAPVYGLTFKLLVTSEGKKMGKTESGALWLDPGKTSPYDFYQYWRNVDDRDVPNCLALLTFLPMDEVNRLASFTGADINLAKEILAFEITKLVHGGAEAEKAQTAARALFGSGGDGGSIPSTEFGKAVFETGIDIISLLSQTGLISTNSDGRRLIQQGGIMLNGEIVTEFDRLVTMKDIQDGRLMLRKGKKSYHQAVIRQIL